jgi:hypothetical protein
MFGSFTPPPDVTLSGVYSATASNGDATFTGVNLGVAAPSNMVVVILIGSDLDPLDEGGISVTVGGVAATLVDGITDGNGDNDGTTVGMWRASVPNGGTGSIVVNDGYYPFKTFTANAIVYYARYLRSQTPHHTDTDIDDTLSFSLNIPDEGFAIAAGVFQSAGSATATGLTENVDQAGSEQGQVYAASSENMAAETGRSIVLNSSANGSGSGVAASWY